MEILSAAQVKLEKTPLAMVKLEALLLQILFKPHHPALRNTQANDLISKSHFAVRATPAANS